MEKLKNKKGIVVISGPYCKNCVTLKNYLNKKGVIYKEFDIEKREAICNELNLKLEDLKMIRSLPQLYKDGELVLTGSFDKVKSLEEHLIKNNFFNNENIGEVEKPTKKDLVIDKNWEKKNKLVRDQKKIIDKQGENVKSVSIKILKDLEKELKLIENQLKEKGIDISLYKKEKKEVRKLTKAQLRIVNINAPKQIKEELKNNGATKKIYAWLDKYFKELPLKIKYGKLLPFTIKQLSIIDKNAPQDLKATLIKEGHTGAQYGAKEKAAEWLEQYFRERNFKQKYPLSEKKYKQLLVIEKFAPVEIQKILITHGDTKEVNEWFDKNMEEYKNNKAKEVKKDIKNLNSPQMEKINETGNIRVFPVIDNKREYVKEKENVKTL